MGDDNAYKLDTLNDSAYYRVMDYGKKILERVDKLTQDVKNKFTLYFTVAVYDEFRRKCGDRAPSVVLEEMMKEFNESVPEPREKKK